MGDTNTDEKTKAARPTWDEYFIRMAELASTRSVCSRSKCGAVIVKDKNVISTGYNGAPHGQPNCLEVGFCYRNKNAIKSGTSPELCRAAGCHSESNAIALAAKHGNATTGATMYIYGNSDICTQCRGMIANCGITRVVYMTKFQVMSEYKVPEDWSVHPVDR